MVIFVAKSSLFFSSRCNEFPVAPEIPPVPARDQGPAEPHLSAKMNLRMAALEDRFPAPEYRPDRRIAPGGMSD